MGRQAKFNFVRATDQVAPSANQYTITLRKNGSFWLPHRFIEDKKYEGSIIEFFVDAEKHSIGFRKLGYKLEELTGDQKEKIPKLARPIKMNSTGMASVGIGRVLKNQSWYKPGNYRAVLQEYQDSLFGEIWYFTIGEPVEVDGSKNSKKEN